MTNEENCDHLWMVYKYAEPVLNKLYLSFYCQKCLKVRLESYTDGDIDGSKKHN
jgi:hypothetical protein